MWDLVQKISASIISLVYLVLVFTNESLVNNDYTGDNPKFTAFLFVAIGLSMIWFSRGIEAATQFQEDSGMWDAEGGGPIHMSPSSLIRFCGWLILIATITFPYWSKALTGEVIPY